MTPDSYQITDWTPTRRDLVTGDQSPRERPQVKDQHNSYSSMNETQANDFKEERNSSIHKSKDPASKSLLSDQITTISGDGTQDDEKDVAPKWTPTWLRTTSLAAFMVLFVVLTAALPAMLAYSNSNDGIAETRQSLVYLWRFGPTAAITLISLFWARVETQAMRYMPWIVLRHTPNPSHKDYALDYTAMLSPVVLIQSLKRRHIPVFIAAAAALLLKLLIVLAPSLYNLRSIELSRPLDIEVLSFINTSTPAPYREYSPYYLAKAIRNFDMERPFGVTADGVYQTFSPRGTVNAPLNVTVDGFYSEMQCLKLEEYTASAAYTGLGYTLKHFTIDVELQFEGCDRTVPVRINQIPWNDDDTFMGAWAVNTSLEMPTPCSNLDQQQNQALYYAGYIVAESLRPKMLNFDAVLCSSTSWFSKVEVIDDGISPNVTAIPGSNTTATIDLWNLVGKSIPADGGNWAVLEPKINNDYRLLPGPLQTILKLSYGTANISDISLYSSELLQESVMNVTRLISPLMAHYHLRQVSQSQVVGNMAVSVNKLMVNQLTCLWMTALFAVIGLLTALLFELLRGKTDVGHRDPATMLGNMLFYQDISRLPKGPIRFSQNINSSWSHCNFTPLVLRAWAQICMTVLVSTVTIGLICVLELSRTSDGLSTIDEDGRLHLLWTSVPAIIMLSITLYMSCCGSALRELSAISSLSSRQCGAREIDTSLLDMLGVRAMFCSVRSRLWAVTLSQFLVILCGFLTTLASILFTVESVPEPKVSALQQTSWFGSREFPASRGNELTQMDYTRKAFSSLLLRQGDGALTYPRNTYHDLLFPSYDPPDGFEASSNITIHLEAAAAKLTSSCSKVAPNDLNITIVPNQFNPLDYITIVGQNLTCPNGTRTQVEKWPKMTPEADRLNQSFSYFAYLLPSIEDPYIISRRCFDKYGDEDPGYWYPMSMAYTHAWGTFSHEKREFQHLSVWRCNYAWSEVPTKIALIYSADGDLVLDPKSPPQPDMLRARPWKPDWDVPRIDNEASRLSHGFLSNGYPGIELNDELISKSWDDSRYKVLIEPYGPFRLSALSDPKQEQAILDKINSNYGFIAAQVANVENRFGANQESRNMPPPEHLPITQATVTDKSRRRLVQNPIITYVLVAILSFVSLSMMWRLFLIALRRVAGKPWSFDAGFDVKNLAPDGFHSMAAISSLLSNSNAMEYLPHGTELMSLEDLYSRLDDVSFRMGWFQRASDKSKVFTVGVMGDEDFKFLGGKTDINPSLSA